jgi:hypothetical protein
VWFVCLAASAGFIAAQAARADDDGRPRVVSCPAGQAIQSINIFGKTVCVPVPDPATLEGAISSEAAARAAGDAQLQNNIDNEASLRSVMDTALQNAIDVLNPSRIEGTYTFSGTQVCINSTFGFNDDLTPASSPDGRGAAVSQFTAISTGTRTFNSDGTGTAEVEGFTMSFPGAFYTNPPLPSLPFTGVTTGGSTSKPAGGVAAFKQAGTFTWRAEGGKLIIEDGPIEGTILQGGSTAGCTLKSSNLPASVGTLGKDLKIISMIPGSIRVETSEISCLDGRKITALRICNRERLLRKM